MRKQLIYSIILIFLFRTEINTEKLNGITLDIQSEISRSIDLQVKELIISNMNFKNFFLQEAILPESIRDQIFNLKLINLSRACPHSKE